MKTVYQWGIFLGAIGTGFFVFINPRTAEVIGGMTFGLIGILMACEAKSAMRKRNRAIEESWHAHKKEEP